MQLPKSEQLIIASLSRLFDNKAECYKLFWFQAILNHVCKGQQEHGEGCGEKMTQSFYNVHAKEYADLTVRAEDALPSDREQKWLNVVLGKR